MNAIGMSRRHRAELNGASDTFMRSRPFCCGDDKRLYVPGLCSPSTLTAGRTARPSQCGPARFRPKGGHRGAPFQLTAKGVQVRFVKQQLTFTGEDTVMANLLLSVMGAFAEFERSLIGARQREGIALAKARGAYRGRKKSLTEDQVDQLRQREPARARRGRRWPTISVSAARPSTNTCARHLDRDHPLAGGIILISRGLVGGKSKPRGA